MKLIGANNQSQSTSKRLTQSRRAFEFRRLDQISEPQLVRKTRPRNIAKHENLLLSFRSSWYTLLESFHRRIGKRSTWKRSGGFCLPLLAGTCTVQMRVWC